MSILRRAMGFVIVLAAAWPAAHGGVRLLLKDGQILEGRSFERTDSYYVLTLDTDHVLPIPASLVLTVELFDDPRTLAGEPGAQTDYLEPQTLAGDPRAQLPYLPPQTLAGNPDMKLPTWTEQTRVLADGMSRFRRSVIDPNWYPTSSLGPDVTHFNPVRWFESPIDPHWYPTSSLGEDVSNFNPVRWYQAPIDSTWWPTDGFARRDSEPSP